MTAHPDLLDLNMTRQALDRLARNLAPAARRAPLPAHLILAARGALEATYGPATAQTIHEALVALALVSGGGLVYVDDPLSAAALATEPLPLTGRSEDWRDWLDAAAPGATSVLLIGGPDLVPFGVAVNPSDDDDGVLATDTPYAGGGPLTPRRAVGRLPDGGDAAYLVRLIRATTEAHDAARRAAAPRWLGHARTEGRAAIGYTASVWRHAARVVYTAIDAPQRLRMSPPLDAEAAPPIQANAFSPAYFNLHGLRDTPGWYGHRDPLLAADYPAFPLALAPDQLLPAPRRRLIVFSAACHGAHLDGKSATNSMALRFLDTQAAAFVGSTAVAYGGLSEPLQATDQLALLFWYGLRRGLSVGEALRQAKTGLVEAITARQGYLDAEDRKALLTFVLYGDPSLRPFAAHQWAGLAVGNAGTAVGGVARLAAPPMGAVTLSPATLRRVERDVRARLPDLGPLRIHIAPPAQPKAVGETVPAPTLTLMEDDAARPFRHLVKVTLGPDGSIAKLVMAHG